MRRASPVQQWLDSLPVETQNEESTEDQEHTTETKSDESKTEQTITGNTIVEPTDNTIVEQSIIEPEPSLHEETNLEVPTPIDQWKRKSLESGVLISSPQNINVKKKLQRDYSIQSEGCAPKIKNPLLRDQSLQSDASGSSGSSVLNVLGARKVDAESVLLALGFGPSEKQQKLQRIPDRFLIPSKLKGISTEQFIKDEQHSMRMHDCGIFGYRGLTGNPHVPPSTIVAKIMDCILQDEVCREEAMLKARHSIADMRSPPAAHAQFMARFHLRQKPKSTTSAEGTSTLQSPRS